MNRKQSQFSNFWIVQLLTNLEFKKSESKNPDFKAFLYLNLVCFNYFTLKISHFYLINRSKRNLQRHSL